MRFEAFKGSLICDTLGEQALIALFRGYNAVFRDFNRLLARFDLTEPQFNILLLLAQGEGMSLSKLGEKMLVTRSNITGLIDRLEREGLIVRDTIPSDRRATIARITEKGLAVLREAVPLLCKRINDITKVLSDEEKKGLVESLRKLRHGIGEG